MPPHSTAARQNLHSDKYIKDPVRAASTANVSTSSPGATLDGVTLASGDRILLKDQTTGSQNGIYIWTGSSAALTRATDASAAADFVFGFQVYVREGTTNGATFWKYTQSAAVTLGTTAITFARLDSSGLTDPTTTRGDLLARGASSLGRLALGASGTFLGAGATDPAWTNSATKFTATGDTGATAASAYVGGTASGAPTTGAHALGDYVIDQTGKLWICTTAGTPGTWTQVSGGAAGGGVSVGSAITAAVAADVTITTAATFYDGPSVTVGAGTWILVGSLTLLDTSTSARFTAKLWDGTTGSGHELSSGELGTGGANIPVTIPLVWVVAPTTSTTYKLSATSNQSTNGRIKADAPDNPTTPHTASVLVAVPVPPVAVPYVNIQDQKTQNTAGGSFTSGADQQRVLNTVASDDAGLVSLSSNQFTLPAGTYRYNISAPGFGCGRHQAWLYNITDSAIVNSRGTSEISAANACTCSLVKGRIHITATKTFEVRHRCAVTATVNGFGVESNFGTEVYTIVELWKEG